MSKKDARLTQEATRLQPTAERHLLIGVYLCRQCGKVIDHAKVAKNGKKKRPQFCNRACRIDWLKAQGFYATLSKAGNDAQRKKRKQG